MSALQREYEEGMNILGESRMKFYKCFDLFSFDNGNEIHFGDNIATLCEDKSHYDTLKEYIKEQKKWVRSEEAIPDAELHRRLWWLSYKILQFGLFSPTEARLILQWITTP
jgi:hypothetical protein